MEKLLIYRMRPLSPAAVNLIEMGQIVDVTVDKMHLELEPAVTTEPWRGVPGVRVCKHTRVVEGIAE